MGGKSKSTSSSSQTSTTQQSEQSADGFIGSGANVYNLSSTSGITLSTVDQFPEGVQEIAQALIGLVSDTVTGARDFAQNSLDQVAQRTQEATQPDLTVIKYVPYMIGGIVIVAAIGLILRGK